MSKHFQVSTTMGQLSPNKSTLNINVSVVLQLNYVNMLSNQYINLPTYIILFVTTKVQKLYEENGFLLPLVMTNLNIHLYT